MTNPPSTDITSHRIVSRAEWMRARTAFLEEEKEFTKRRDELNRKRRELPWTKVEKPYVFDGAAGKRSLADLFDGRSQLLVYQFMYDPDWKAGCPICSFWADNFNGIVEHLRHRDVTMAAISRAPIEKLAAYQKRMGWSFPWYSSAGTDFNFDHQASFTPQEVERKQAIYNFTKQDPRRSEREGVSVFYKDQSGEVFQTYAAFARGIDMFNTAYNYLDIVPKGRDENGKGPFWVRRHDEY